VTIDVIEPTGADYFVLTQIGEQSVTARLNARSELNHTDIAEFYFDPQRILAFDKQTGERI
ncbi:MAG: sugar ABC transporter ATP-binding protein, partial [Vibrio sp.]